MIKPLRIAPGAAWESVTRSLDVLLRDVVAAVNRGAYHRLACVIDTDALPVSIELPAGVRPVSVSLERATVQNSGDGIVTTGGVVTWDAQVGGAVRIHTLPALAASTRYDAVIAVWEG